MVDGTAFVRDYLREVFSEGHLDRKDEYLRGAKFIDGVVELATRWRTAFSDFHEEVRAAYQAGDRVITESVMRGTHDGVLMSRVGPIAPTGRRAEWTRIAVRRLDGDRFVDGYFEQDEVGLLQQLGVLPTPESADRGRHSLLAQVEDRR